MSVLTMSGPVLTMSGRKTFDVAYLENLPSDAPQRHWFYVNYLNGTVGVSDEKTGKVLFFKDDDDDTHLGIRVFQLLSEHPYVK